jgi:hypothetical protein
MARSHVRLWSPCCCRANAAYWFEHELRQYPTVDLDVVAGYADRIAVA